MAKKKGKKQNLRNQPRTQADCDRECQKCLDAGDFSLWEDENG